jgi:hypothetical protein
MKHLMISSDVISLYATEVSCDSELRKCSAKGDVLVELGAEQLAGNNAEVDFVKRTFSLLRDPKVLRSF